MPSSHLPTSPANAPALIMSSIDAARLEALATAAVDRFPAAASLLLAEIDRAAVRPPQAVPQDVVAMHVPVEFRDDVSGAIRRIVLVYPQEADIKAGLVSVLTLIGAALIGVTAGSSIECPTVDGKNRTLTVLKVG